MLEAAEAWTVAGMLPATMIAGVLPTAGAGPPRFIRGVRKCKILGEPSFLR